MTSGVRCYEGTLMPALAALSVVVTKGAFLPWHPLQSQSTGGQHTYILASPIKPRRVPWTRLCPKSEVDSLSGFRASRDGSGSSGQIRAPQDKPGPSRTNRGPVERIRAPLGQPGPAGRVRALGRIGCRESSQGPAEQIRACGTLSGPWWTNRRGPGGPWQFESGSFGTDLGPAGPVNTPGRIGPRGTY